ncbi:hypothetical protein M427DRAFT_49085 [Gonapodya prolifera JEL478]|uniref:F-box domain-containing protein n=1 Tax=Gonapodya prolifera (strain JEL478) TaxID=1344416 RepID=A0A138ZZ59_GONPJ|nr:hypothetical protein M427DRAFT_49085 [Gonapodya prolifera JEL478]|eukprot:KXS09796.1 hypothetical protein M427DRAFT_49085 [Gonapodya prolifera JEL478]
MAYICSRQFIEDSVHYSTNHSEEAMMERFCGASVNVTSIRCTLHRRFHAMLPSSTGNSDFKKRQGSETLAETQLQPTFSVDAPPLEVLHRIFRFLPPKSFQSQVPLFSRHLRAAARTAIPGCGQGELGLSITIKFSSNTMWGPTIEEEPTWEEYALQTVRFLPRFESGRPWDQGQMTASVIWASCSALVVLDEAELEGSSTAGTVFDTVLSKFDRWNEGQQNFRLLKISVPQLIMRDEFSGNRNGLTNQNCNMGILINASETWPNTVNEVELSSAQGSLPNDILYGRGVAIILLAFPHVSAIRGA